MPADPGKEPRLFQHAPGIKASPDGHLTAFRYSGYDVPFWVRPNTRAGRWNLAGQDPTQYWSLTPSGAWAELIRHEEITTEKELAQVQMRFWVCRIHRNGLLDLREPTNLDQFEVSIAQLVADDWTICQTLASRLREQFQGILTPSAALDGAASLVMFGPRRAIEFDREPKLASAVPAEVAAIGRPPSDILGKVNFAEERPTLF